MLRSCHGPASGHMPLPGQPDRDAAGRRPGHRLQHQLGAETRGHRGQRGHVGHRPWVGEHDVDGQCRGVRRQDVEVLARRESLGLPRLGGQVQHDHAAGVGAHQRVAQTRHHEVRQHAGEPGARAEHHPVGLLDGPDRLLAGHRGRRLEQQLHHPAGCRRHGHLPTDDLRRRLPVERDGGSDADRLARHRQHPTLGAEQPPDLVQRGDRVAQQLPQPDDQQVAHGVPVELSPAAEPVLRQPAPQLAPLVVAAQCCQRHPQVARRQAAELVAQPAAGPAVVRHGDHGRQPVGDPAQGLQRGGQPVTPAQGHDRGARRHSRPRSRCST